MADPTANQPPTAPTSHAPASTDKVHGAPTASTDKVHGVATPSSVELRFFPDEGNHEDGGATGHLYAFQGTSLLGKIEARGGPRTSSTGRDGHTAGQTSP